MLACPTPAASAPNQSGTRPGRRPAAFIQSGRLRWLHRLPGGLLACHGVLRVQGQGRPPGQTVPGGHTTTEASFSFTGNLTDDPEVRYTEGGNARAMFRWT